MTLFDFLAQASGWQWFGLIFLAAVISAAFIGACKGLGNLRVHGDITNNKTKHVYFDRKEAEDKLKK
jgi:hypothetical protein